MSRRGESGAVSVHAVTVAVMLLVLTLVLVQAAGLVRLRHRVAAAADLAALAASQASVAGSDGCRAARAIARRNGAELVDCRMDYDVATVTARSESRPWWSASWGTEQRARAAPESYVAVADERGAPARKASSRRIAPALSSGSLPLPHLGE
ncbi:MAG: Rv3654c family TadE-like protein [Aeromicrobium sp.]